MSKPKEYYYSYIKKWIMAKDTLPDDRIQSDVFCKAYEEAIKETLKLPNGELRIKAVDEILVKKIRTYEGVGQDIHYNPRTVQAWVTSFVNLVGRKAGF